MGITIITSLIALLVVAFALQGIKIVQQSETVIVERLGKYHSTLKSGLNIITTNEHSFIYEYKKLLYFLLPLVSYK